MNSILSFLCFIFIMELVEGRGSMLNPPQRSSLWRFRPWKHDKTIPKNLEDYGLNCGGFWRLHGINKGKCGICGDPYDEQARPNEAGGKFANGIIVRRYRQNKNFINVTIDVAANIGGHFEFRLCPNNNISEVVTQECFDQNQLTIEDHGLQFKPESDRKYKLALVMPENITCSHCVLQWKWRGSYNWGRCDDGYQDVGCGNQEEYYNCADIAILPSNGQVPVNTATSSKHKEMTTGRQETTTGRQEPTTVRRETTAGRQEAKIQTTVSLKGRKTMSKDVSTIKSIDNILRELTNEINPVNSGYTGKSYVSWIPVYILKQETTSEMPSIDKIETTEKPSTISFVNQQSKNESIPPQVSVGVIIDLEDSIFSETFSEKHQTQTVNDTISEPFPVKYQPHAVNGSISEPFPKKHQPHSVNGSIPSSLTANNTIYDVTFGRIIDEVRQDLVQSPGNNIFNKAEWIAGKAEVSSALNASGASGIGYSSASGSNTAVTNTSLTPMLNASALNASSAEIGILIATENSTLDPATINRNVNMLNQMFYGAAIAGGDTGLDALLTAPLLQTFTQVPPFGDLADQFMQSTFVLHKQRENNEPDVQVSELYDKDSNFFRNTELLEIYRNNISSTAAQTSLEGLTTSSIQGYENGINESIIEKNTNISTTMTTSELNFVSGTLHKHETSTVSTPFMTQQLEPITSTTGTSSLQQNTENQWYDVLLKLNDMLTSLNNQLTFQTSDSTTEKRMRNNNMSESPIDSSSNQSALQISTNSTTRMNSDDVSKSSIGLSNGQSTMTVLNKISAQPNLTLLPEISGQINSDSSVNSGSENTDGVVVSGLDRSPVRGQDNAYVERPSIDIIDYLDAPGKKLSQQPKNVFVDKILNSDFINRIPSTDNTLQETNPMVISDPKSKFSFRDLDARNVEINEITDIVEGSIPLNRKSRAVAQKEFPENNTTPLQESSKTNDSLPPNQSPSIPNVKNQVITAESTNDQINVKQSETPKTTTESTKTVNIWDQVETMKTNNLAPGGSMEDATKIAKGIMSDMMKQVKSFIGDMFGQAPAASTTTTTTTSAPITTQPLSMPTTNSYFNNFVAVTTDMFSMWK